MAKEHSRVSQRVRRHRFRKKRGIQMVEIPVAEFEIKLLQHWGYCEPEASRREVMLALRTFLKDCFDVSYADEYRKIHGFSPASLYKK